MNQKRGNNGQKFKRKFFFLVKIWARKKGFLKPKSGQNWQKIEEKKKPKIEVQSQNWTENEPKIKSNCRGNQ